MLTALNPLTAVVALLVLANILSAGVASAADKWIRVRTDHFDTVGNTTDTELRRVAQTLEHFHDVVVSAVLRGAGDSPTRTEVIIFKDDASFTPYKPQGAGRSSLGGLFFLDADHPLLTLNGQNLAYAFLTVLDGYSRAIVQRTTNQAPIWLSTGLGLVYQTFEERSGGKGALIGRPNADIMGVLKGATLMPLATFIALDRSSPKLTLGSADRRLFEGQSWALAHYLTFGARREQLRQYLAALQAGSSSEPAFRAAVGDLTVLDRELREYIMKFVFPAIQIVFDEKVAPSLPPRGEVLSEADAESYLAPLLARTGYVAQARARLEKVLTTTPDSASATAALARMELSENKFDKGLPLFERAASLAPEDARIQADLGHLLAYEVGRTRGAAAEDLTHARAVLERALTLAPEHVDSIADLGWLLLFQPDDAARAATLLTRAVEQAPAREQFKLWLGDALLRDRQFDKARFYLGPLVARGTPATSTEARRLLATISARESRPTRPAVVGAPPSSAVATTSAGSGRASTAAAAPGVSRFTPTLRATQAGETRSLGSFRAVECADGSVALLVDVDGRVLRLAASRLADVDFVSYRQDAPTNVGCGAVTPPQRVLVTYRMSSASDTRSSGTAVAIELLPDGYTPQ